MGKFPHTYSGPASNFPAMDTWKDFDTLFNINKPFMFEKGDTESDVDHINTGIRKFSKELAADGRVILCIIMQESRRNVGENTPKDRDHKPTPGLMQCVGSRGYPGQHGFSQDQIYGMISAGTKHDKGNLKTEGDAWDAPTIYKALRLYNSGIVDVHNLSNGEGATPDYVSDIANRLQGHIDGYIVVFQCLRDEVIRSSSRGVAVNSP